jgi:hypothetical protein
MNVEGESIVLVRLAATLVLAAAVVLALCLLCSQGRRGEGPALQCGDELGDLASYGLDIPQGTSQLLSRVGDYD